MNIEQIIRSWKNNEETTTSDAPENPIGAELSDQELSAVTGGMPCEDTCGLLSITCWITEFGV